jgi:hypothetical protein
MRVKLCQIIVLGLSLGVIILNSPASARADDRGGDRGGNYGERSGGPGIGANMGNMGAGAAESAKGAAQMGRNFSGNAPGEMFQGRSNFKSNFGNMDRGRADFDRGRADWNRWDNRYSSYYGRGWDYRPGFGWGINVPLGRYGGIGFGDYYGYYGSPYYYGRSGWNYWGPDGYYGNWGPGYDTYGYDSSTPMYSEASKQPAQEEQAQGQLPPLPSSKELARFTDRQLQNFIAWAANGYTRELAQYSTGNTWVKYFRLDDLKALAPNAPGAAPKQMPDIASAKSRNVIDEVLDRLDSASKNDEYKTITNSWGFQALQVALKEASKSPEERGPGVLKGQAEVLSNSLKQLSTGDSWRKHLEIDTIEKLADQKDLQSNEDLQKITERFDKVTRNPEYQAIAQLPGFTGVYSTLHKLSDGEQHPSTARKVPSPPEETTHE